MPVALPRLLLIMTGLGLSLTFAVRLRADEADNAYERNLRLLGEAQQRGDEQTVIELAKQMQKLRGDLAGHPDAEDRVREFSGHEPTLTDQEIKNAFNSYYAEIIKRKWWRVGDDPQHAARPLRDIASVIVGCTFACRAECNDSDKVKALAEDGAEYLMWAQRQAGTGVFPFPAARQTRGRPFESARRLLQKAERAGVLEQVVVNGWIVDDLGDGGLQFDNGNCGVALIELYRLTGHLRYLKAAEEAAAWARSRPVVPNWNYNSFSVYLLAEASRETNNAAYRKSAIQKARLGIYPGQIVRGRQQGRWFDSHNARPEYHFLIVRSLVALVAGLEPGSPERQQATKSLLLALQARNGELATGKIVAVEPALESLLLLDQYLPDSKSVIGDAEQASALRTLGGYCIRSFRQGRLPVAPGAWGRYLEYSQRMAKQGENYGGGSGRR